jgi:hypothetical protein
LESESQDTGCDSPFRANIYGGNCQCWRFAPHIPRPLPLFPFSSTAAAFPWAAECTSTTPPIGTVDGTVANRRITITAKDKDGAALTTDKAQFVVEAYTNSPSCYPYATTPNCQVMCTPWAWPNVKSPSCLSVPHVWNSTSCVSSEF